MASIIYVENRVTGERTYENIERNSIKIEGPSDIHLGVTRDDIASRVRSGNDLVLTLQDGAQIILEDYFAFESEMELSFILLDGEGGGAAVPFEFTSGLLLGGWGLLMGGGLLAAGVAAALNGGDTTAPAAPTAPDAPTIDTSNGDTLAGMAEPGSTVTVTLEDGSTETTLADEDGNYAFEPNPVPDGQTATLTATDEAGNVSDETPVPTVDATAPDAPAVVLANDTAGTNDGDADDGITNDSTINVTGLEAGATWEYTTNGGDATPKWTVGTGSSFELAQGVYDAGDVQVRQTDAAGNVSDPGGLGDVKMLAISLEGVLGKDGTELGGGLINPVEVMINGDTRTFYHWDRNGDGIANLADRATHDLLDNLFNNGADTTDEESTRSLDIPDGPILRLPTINDATGYPGDGLNNGTEVSSGTENQTTYDGLLAIWDAHNGDGTGQDINGTPEGWASVSYWSATSTGAGLHARLYLIDGSSSSTADGSSNYVALEVV